VIDSSNGKLVTNIPLGGKPEYAATAGNGKVYANITDNSEVVEIDSGKLAVSRRWSTEPCKQPVSMAIDTKNHRLFSGCRSGVLAVSDYTTGKIVATMPIGMGVDGTAFDPSSGDVFASNADGTLTVIHQDSADKYHVTETVQTPQASRNMGLDPRNHRLYVPAADFGPAAANARPSPAAGTFRILVIERSAGK
jgi:DNA-binding beta-propeller fold protein YncE